MVSCLILYSDSIEKRTKKMILDALLQFKDYEILDTEDNTSIIFLWNMMKQDIWQCALDLEFAGIHVGYGFGCNKKEAEKNANLILQKRNDFYFLKKGDT